MALADRVKGLGKHKIEVPPPAPPVFDQHKADVLLLEINAVLASSYPAGCLEWITANRRDIWQELCAGENAVDSAYINHDMPALEIAIDRLRRMYLRAYEVFTTRPPVIEVQAALAL